MKINLKIFFLIVLLSAFQHLKLFSQNRTFDSIITIINTKNNDTLKALELIDEAGKLHLAKPEISIKLLLAAKSISEKSDFKKGIGDAHGWLGYIYNKQGKIKNALECHFISLKILEERKDFLGVASTYNNLGLIYSSQGDQKKALESYLKSYETCSKIKYKPGIAAATNNLGFIYGKLGDIDKSFNYFNLGLQIRLEINDTAAIGYSYNNLANLFYKKGDWNKSLEYYRKSLISHRKMNDITGVIFSLNNLACILFEQGQSKEAKSLALEAYKLSLSVAYPQNLKHSASTLKSIYKGEKNYKSALEMMELEVKMNDSISNEANRKASVKSQLKYEYEKQAAADSVVRAKESEIKNVQLQKQSAEIKVKKNQQYALFGGLGLVILFAGFMYNRFKVTQKQKLIIEEQKEIVEEQKKIVEQKQKEVLDSIHYAKRIQLAQIPSEKRVQQILNRLRKS